MLKFILFDNYFPDLFTEVQIWYWKSFKFGLRRFFRKVSSGRLKKVTTSYDLEKDVGFMTFWRRLIYVVLKMSNLWGLKDVLVTMFSGRLVCNVLKTSDLRRLEDVQFATSWKRLIYDVLKTSVKRHPCSNIVAASIQRRIKNDCFLFCTFWNI